MYNINLCSADKCEIHALPRITTEACNVHATCVMGQRFPCTLAPISMSLEGREDGSHARLGKGRSVGMLALLWPRAKCANLLLYSIEINLTTPLQSLQMPLNSFSYIPVCKWLYFTFFDFTASDAEIHKILYNCPIKNRLGINRGLPNLINWRLEKQMSGSYQNSLNDY